MNTTNTQKYYDVDMEDPVDPYGDGVGFTVSVVAKNRREALFKVRQQWKDHEYNHEHWYDDFKPFKIRLNKNIIK